MDFLHLGSEQPVLKLFRAASKITVNDNTKAGFDLIVSNPPYLSKRSANQSLSKFSLEHEPRGVFRNVNFIAD